MDAQTKQIYADALKQLGSNDTVRTIGTLFSGFGGVDIGAAMSAGAWCNYPCVALRGCNRSQTGINCQRVERRQRGVSAMPCRRCSIND